MMIWWMLATAVLVLLGGYAAWLWYQVWRRAQAHGARQHAQQHMLLDQLEVLARTVVQRQVNITEGALRMATLLDLLVETPPTPVDVAAIHRLADAARSFAVGAQRQALSRADRAEQDRAREQLEAEQGAEVEAASARLLAELPHWR